jgi:uncharacterized phage protein gp47/JayE
LSSFDESGLLVDGLADVTSNLETLFKEAFGENTNVAADSVFGQIINIMALAITEQNELIESVAQSFNPQTASGSALSNLVLINGIQRQESAFSTVSVSCTANAKGTTIPAGSLVKDPDSNIKWSTDSQLVLGPSATNSVSCTCTTAGPNSAAANTITEISTPVYGWASCTNASAASEGQDEESNAELRLRRQTTAERSSSTSIGALAQAVSDLTGVSAVLVIENVTDTVDDNGVPAHSIWVIVQGGVDADIREQIFLHKASGIGTYGDTSGSYSDSVTQQSYTIYHERPADINIYITVNVSPDETYPVDGDDQIEDALLAYATANWTLGKDVIHSRLYTPINSIEGHTVDSLYIGTSSNPTQTDDIPILPNQKAVTDSVRVIVNS